MFKIKKLATYEVIQYFWSSGSGFKSVNTFMELLKEIEEEVTRKFCITRGSIDDDLLDILTEFWEYVENTKGYTTEDKIKDRIEIQRGDYEVLIRTFISGSGRTTEYVVDIESADGGLTLVIQVGRRIPIDV